MSENVLVSFPRDSWERALEMFEEQNLDRVCNPPVHFQIVQGVEHLVEPPKRDHKEKYLLEISAETYPDLMRLIRSHEKNRDRTRQMNRPKKNPAERRGRPRSKSIRLHVVRTPELDSATNVVR